MKPPFEAIQELAEMDRAKVIAANMIKYGHGFVKHLGVRLAQMNIDEIREFKEGFPSYYHKYEEIAEAD